MMTKTTGTAQMTYMPPIYVRVLAPTKTLGARVVAVCPCCKTTVTLPWYPALSPAENIAKAAEALMERKGYTGRWVGAHTKDETVFVHVGGA
jgi:hypothetical protein